MSSTDRQARMPDPTVKCFNVSVVGLPSNKLRIHGMPGKAKLAQGIGKSYLCERFLRSGMADGDSFDRQSRADERHSSVIGKRRFAKEGEIFGEHYFYHGSVAKTTQQHGLVAFHVVEHTTFVNSNIQECQSSASDGKEKAQIDYVVRATTAKLACPGKTSCCSGGEPFPSDFSVDAFLFAVDVTQDEENIVLQLDLLADVSSRVANLGKPLAVAFTKCDFMRDGVVVEMEKRVRTTVKGVSVCQLSARTGVGVDAAFALVYEESVSEGNPQPVPLSYSASKTAKLVAERTAIRDVRKLLESATDFSITWEEFLKARDGSLDACLYALLSFQGPEACLRLFQQRLQVLQVEKLKRSLREAILAHPNLKNVDIDQFERSVFREDFMAHDDTENIDHLFEQYKLPADGETRSRISSEAKIYYNNAVLSAQSSDCKWLLSRFPSHDCEPGSRDAAKEGVNGTYIVCEEKPQDGDVEVYEDMSPAQGQRQVDDSSSVNKRITLAKVSSGIGRIRTLLTSMRSGNSEQQVQESRPLDKKQARQSTADKTATPAKSDGNGRPPKPLMNGEGSTEEALSQSFGNDNGKEDVDMYEVMSASASLPSITAAKSESGQDELDTTSIPLGNAENVSSEMDKGEKNWPKKSIGEKFRQWRQGRKDKKAPSPSAHQDLETDNGHLSTPTSEFLYDDVINSDEQLDIYEEVVTSSRKTDGTVVAIHDDGLSSSMNVGDYLQPADVVSEHSLRTVSPSFLSSTQSKEEPPPLPERSTRPTISKSTAVLAASQQDRETENHSRNSTITVKSNNTRESESLEVYEEVGSSVKEEEVANRQSEGFTQLSGADEGQTAPLEVYEEISVPTNNKAQLEMYEEVGGSQLAAVRKDASNKRSMSSKDSGGEARERSTSVRPKKDGNHDSKIRIRSQKKQTNKAKASSSRLSGLRTKLPSMPIQRTRQENSSQWFVNSRRSSTAGHDKGSDS